jgi:hypothetical protein
MMDVSRPGAILFLHHTALALNPFLHFETGNDQKGKRGIMEKRREPNKNT